ncbi:hypothetical protein J8L85_15040 [Maribacter sp. MMG018]|uniref:DUF6452 family protein n=1 Tax=Maribacter sp. MMG018 TaxID=2822688 RepID=UPI001B360AD4|nr:DUF6452 family protein [Maribacter sp. MMG018]MBQ4915769.1 hypothetical protein [Maribacter sp. MMG018]
MAKFRLFVFILLGILMVASCEKDDICIEGDTPLLVIEFYDISDTTELKSVTALRVVGEGQSTTVNTISDRSDLNTITLPLKTDEDETTFLLISDSASDESGAETGNIDTVTFNYERIEDFASRACGFVISYSNLSANVQTDSEPWIADIEVVISNFTNSDSTHVKIFH